MLAAAGSPPPQVLITVQKSNRRAVTVDLPGLRIFAEPFAPFTVGSEVAFDLWERWTGGIGPEGIEGQVRCSPAIVNSGYIESLLNELLSVLKAALASPDGPVDVSLRGTFRGQTGVQTPDGDKGGGSLSDSSRSDMRSEAHPAAEGARPNPDRLYTPALNPTHDRLICMWEKLLGIRRIGVWDDYFELGGQTCMIPELTDEINRVYGQQISPSLFERGMTVGEIADVLAKRLPSTGILQVQAGDIRTKPPLWLFHGDYNGGGLYCWELRRSLCREQPLYALPPHGVNGGHVPDSLEDMASEYLGLIRSVQPDGPYYFAGYCIGGLVALEAARRLKCHGQRLGGVFLIDSHYWAGPPAPPSSKPDGSAPPGIGPAEAQFWRYVVAGQEYRPKPFPGKITLLFPEERSFATYDPSVPWQTVGEQLEVRWLAGGHITCLGRHAESLGRTLQECLVAARTEP
jgi:thioesterase domain-containing protein